MRRARASGATLASLFEAIFAQDRYPEQLYRSCDGLLALAKKTDPKIFTKVCSIALEHQNYSWRFIDNLVKNNMTAHQDPPLSKQLPKHGNVRGRDYYQQTLKL